jgi:predicted nucleotidyltransferase
VILEIDGLRGMNALQKTLSSRDDIALSFLFGGQARGDNHEQSDWDIAIIFKDNTNGWDNLGNRKRLDIFSHWPWPLVTTRLILLTCIVVGSVLMPH